MYVRVALLIILSVLLTPTQSAEPYLKWRLDHYSVTKPLGGLLGDPDRGRRIVSDRETGNCLACHRMPISEQMDHGEIGPPLTGVGSRLTPGQLRLRVINERLVNPDTIMPAFYLNPELANRVSDTYWGKTILTAQQVEDVVAYLVTLK